MEPIIEIKDVGKKYNINHQRGTYVAMRDVLTNIAKSPFRFLKQKAKAAVGLSSREEFWALRNVNVTIQKGEVVGIIGANGAGKSTLLKILTGITPPTEGEIIMRGRVASLLEVGTGFHPELTGRENIFLNGAILGMAKKEIARKFDEIVSFAGIEKFLDTPVKYYSSGMYVRLAFSVAAHMEPDILLVDEVLAVGDAEFQKKCLGKMEEVAKTSGRTIIFVSHNMGAIQALCSHCILLEHGTVKAAGSTASVISSYLSQFHADGALKPIQIIEDKQRVKGNKQASIRRVGVRSGTTDKNTYLINEPLDIDIDFDVQNSALPISFWILFRNQDGQIVLNTFQKDQAQPILLKSGSHTMHIHYDDIGLMPGSYIMIAGIFSHQSHSHFEFADWVEPAQMIEVSAAFQDGSRFDERWGLINKHAAWHIDPL